jgi:hypothetical protein
VEEISVRRANEREKISKQNHSKFNVQIPLLLLYNNRDETKRLTDYRHTRTIQPTMERYVSDKKPLIMKKKNILPQKVLN